MLRSLFWTLALSAVTAAALLVPIEGRSIWDRARDRGLPQAVGKEADRAIAWLKTVGKESPPPKAQARTVKKAKPAERITRADRADLDKLVESHR